MAEAGAIRAGRAYIELFTSDAKLKAGFAAAEKSMMAFGHRVTSGMKAAAASVQSLGADLLKVGAGAAAGIAVASKSFGAYEQSLASLRANTGMTTEELKKADKAATDMSESLGQGPTGIMDIMVELAKSGKTLKTGLVGITETVTKFKKVAGIEGEEASGAITNAMNVFGVSAEDAADTLSRAADASTISIQDVLLSFSQVAPVAKLVGGEMKDLGAAVALLGNEGVKGSDAGTSLKTMLVALIKPTDTGKKVIRQYGLNFRDAAGKLLDFGGIAGELQRGLGGLNEEAQQQAIGDLFGSDAIRAGAILMTKGAEGIREFRKGMADSLSVSQKYAILMDTLMGSIERLRATAERASIAIGTVLKGSFTRMIEVVGGTLKGLAQLAVENGELLRSFVPIVATVLAAGAAFTALGIALGLVMSPLGLLAVGAGAAYVALRDLAGAADTFATAWKAIGDALAKGDLKGAAQVGMLELEIVYRAGTLALLKIWDDWGNALLDVIGHVNAECGKILAEMGAAIQGMAVLAAFPMNAAMRDPLMAAIEVGRQASIAAIEAEEETRKDARRGAGAAGLEERTKALQEARDELAKLSEEANRPPGAFVGPPKPEGLTIPEKGKQIGEAIGAGLEMAREKTDIRGTFSAIGAERGLGAGESVGAKFDKQLAEQQKTTKELEKLNKKAAPLTFT